jgi:hypothetical protein
LDFRKFRSDDHAEILGPKGRNKTAQGRAER